eukprot:TRINITY_DN5092_c0_g1_i1.p1 TRINITY_DN5092_c0_g1~~TRINITY_DN5092_c0_g1_i1.p1  ORF type:complete len:623 (-),score=152.97 TRINITY_DN5092_c0_g1_i1:259-2127(-)
MLNLQFKHVLLLLFAIFMSVEGLTTKPIGAVMVIVDGVGLSSITDESNALTSAKTPFLDEFRKKYSQQFSPLQAAGWSVGARWNDLGSSLIGHQTLGLGRSLPWYSMRLEKMVNDGSFYNNEILKTNIEKAVNSALPKNVHIFGEATDSGVNTDIKYLENFIELCQKLNVPKDRLFVHIILKKISSKNFRTYYNLIKLYLSNFGYDWETSIATILPPRTLDRQEKWHLLKDSYMALLDAKYENCTVSGDIEKTIFTQLDHPFINIEGAKDIFPIINEKSRRFENDDAILFFNYREDSIQEIYRLFEEGPVGKLDVDKQVSLNLVPLSTYYRGIPREPVLPALKPKNGLGEWISKKGFKQIRIGETYKLGHITRFFSGSVLYDKPWPNSEWAVNFTSPSNIQENPEMQTFNLSKKAVESIESGKYDFIFLNIASQDGTGHTGNITCAIRSFQAIDAALKRIYESCEANNYLMVLTADHGNSEMMQWLDGSPQTTHTLNPVPFYITSENVFIRSPPGMSMYSVASVAPTLLYALNIDIPDEMTAPVMIETMGNQREIQINSFVEQEWTVSGGVLILLMLFAMFLSFLLYLLVGSVLKRRNMKKKKFKMKGEPLDDLVEIPTVEI